MAAILKLLQTVDPRTRQYIRYYKISEIYESLLSGVSIVQPEECIPWLLEKLEYLHKIGVQELTWDMFIPDELKPKQKPVDETTLTYIFNVFDEMLEPTPEMIEKAYSHYNKVLHKKVYYSLKKNYLLNLYKRKQIDNKMKIAVNYHKRKVNGFFFNEWREWLKYRKDRQAIADSKLSRVLSMAHNRVILQQWHKASKDARQTREYFEDRIQRLERGEAIDDGDGANGNGEARDDISFLPRNVAIKIFSYLSIVDLYRCAQVCRSWKMITNSNVLWSKVDLYPIRHKLTDKLLASIMKKCRPYVVHLNLRGTFLLSVPSYVSISCCHNIQDINLSDCRNLTDELVNIITSGCQVLLYLNISFNEILTDSTMRCIAKNCKHLQYLSIAFCNRISDKGFSYLANGEGLKNLIYIDMSGCKGITPIGFSHLAHHCTKLERMVMNCFNTLTDKHIRPLGHLSQLSDITIMDSPDLTDDSFKYLSQCKLLKRVRLASNRNISDSSIKLLTRHCPDLRQISITDCERISDASLKCIAACKHLAVLNMADCIRISDIGIKHLTDGQSPAKIRELNLANCIRVGNQSMVCLARKCKNIAFLTLAYCEEIEEDGIDVITSFENILSIDLTGCNCTDSSLKDIGSSTLKHASFSECKGITDLGLQKFCNKSPNLETLDLSFCHQLTDNSIKSLAFCCKFLMNLNISNCLMLTDMSIQYLSGVCIYLQVLDISGCKLISDKSLKYLRKGCKYLKRLVLINCHGISKDMIDKMSVKIAQVEYLPNFSSGHRR